MPQPLDHLDHCTHALHRSSRLHGPGPAGFGGSTAAHDVPPRRCCLTTLVSGEDAETAQSGLLDHVGAVDGNVPPVVQSSLTFPRHTKAGRPRHHPELTFNRR